MLTALPSPRLAQHHAERFPTSLCFHQWEKRIQGDTQLSPALWVTLQEPLLWSHTTRTAGKSSGLLHWKLDYDICRQGVATTSTKILMDSVQLSSNSNKQFCPSAKPSGGVLWPGNSMEQVHVIWILKQGVWLALEPSLPILTQRT